MRTFQTKPRKSAAPKHKRCEGSTNLAGAADKRDAKTPATGASKNDPLSAAAAAARVHKKGWRGKGVR